MKNNYKRISAAKLKCNFYLQLPEWSVQREGQTNFFGEIWIANFNNLGQRQLCRKQSPHVA